MIKNNAFDHYGFTEEYITTAIGLGKKSTYWKSVVAFLEDLKELNYKNLSMKQRNWASAIIDDLKKEI